MIELSIQGGNAKQRKLVEKAIKFCIDLMLPTIRSLHINVELKKQDGVSLLPGDYGSVVNVSGYNSFHMELWKKQNINQLLETTMHEMIHVKQSIKKEWTTYYSKCYWKGIDHTDTSYSQQPWEKQAFRLAGSLVKKFKKISKS
jgi:hypothetical protein